MIRSLTVENFFSFGDSQTFDLEAARNATDPDERLARPIPSSDRRFPKVAVIFGANASGKTNLLRAISFLFGFIRKSMHWSLEDDEPIPFHHFFGDSEDAAVTRFSLEFDARLFNWEEPVVFCYELEIDTKRQAVCREVLKYYPNSRQRLLFDRQGDEIRSGKDFKLSKRDLNKVDKDVSVISNFVKFNKHKFSLEVSNYLGGFSSNVGHLGNNPFLGNPFLSYSITNNYKKYPDILENFGQEIKKFDFGIDKISLEETSEGVLPKFLHKGFKTPIDLPFESQGTQKYYAVFPRLFDALKSGSVMVLDELDNDIHPLILPEIIEKFQDPETNPYNAQLIMSCHNATILEHLIKEEVYFTEKDETGKTEIYGLKDIQGVRRDTNIYANYLAGAFGGIPRVA